VVLAEHAGRRTVQAEDVETYFESWNEIRVRRDVSRPRPRARHPESPDRLVAIKRGLAKCHGVTYEGAAPATEADATSAVHDAGYVEEIQSFCASGGGNWDPDTIACPETWPAALASAGLSMDAVRAALNGADGRNTPFALGRPLATTPSRATRWGSVS